MDLDEVDDAINDLAVALSSQGKLAESVDMFRESYDKHVALLGENHWRTANTGRNIAMALLLLERPAEARPWMERAVRAQAAAEGEDTLGTAYYRAQLASVLDAVGERDEAIGILEASVARIEQLAPPDGIDGLADARVYLGRALVAAGRPAAAEPHLRDAVAFRRRVQPAEHPQLAMVECDLAVRSRRSAAPTRRAICSRRACRASSTTAGCSRGFGRLPSGCETAC